MAKAKECGFIMRTGKACPKNAKYGVRCGRHKGKRNKPVRKSTKTVKRTKKTPAKRKKLKTKSKAGPKKKSKKATKKAGKRKVATSKSKSKTIEFYDVAHKKRIRVPRDVVRVKRANPGGRGGDQLVAKYKGRKLYKFVKRGFNL